MTCKHCCGADQLFDLKGAEKALKKYRKRGLTTVSRRLFSALFDDREMKEKTLLDIGGGIGALQWEFLKSGGRRTYSVDASSGYQQVAASYALEKNLIEQVNFVLGDFTDHADQIPTVDFVTLDKVLCCYPDYGILLDLSLLRCRESIAISYPLGGLIAKFITKFTHLYLMLKKNPFRTYIHSPKEIEKRILSHGFKRSSRRVFFPWHIQVYSRSSSS
jgi:magnesium-protoporphyrin O-methyltransferase